MTTAANEFLAASEAYMAVKLDLDRGGLGIEIISRFKHGEVKHYSSAKPTYNRCGEVVFIGACHLATCTRPGFDSPRR
jgi:hypothetical protein